jgi:hypothetical protein
MNKIFHKVSVITILVLLTLKQSAIPQSVGIGNTSFTPNVSAMLEVQASNKGVLIPRMTLSQRTSILSPAISLLIFQTDNSAGYYYYDGSSWVKLSTGSQGWLLNGNSGTNSGVNFIGTTDNVGFAFRTNNIQRMVITNSGILGIGTNSPNPQTAVDILADQAVMNLKTTNNGNAGINIDKAFGDENFLSFSGNNIFLWKLHTYGDDNFKISYDPHSSDVLTINTNEKVGIGDFPYSDNKLYVYQIGIAGSNYGSSTVNAIYGYGGGAIYSFGVSGVCDGTSLYSGGVHGALSNIVWGALGFRDAFANQFGGYFSGNVNVIGNINVSAGQGYKINNTATTGEYLRGNGVSFASGKIQAGDLPELTIVSKTANYTLTANDNTVIFKGAGITASLPNANTCSGRIYVIVSQTNVLTISPFQNLSDVATTTVSGGTSITIQSNGTYWYQIR